MWKPRKPGVERSNCVTLFQVLHSDTRILIKPRNDWAIDRHDDAMVGDEGGRNGAPINIIIKSIFRSGCCGPVHLRDDKLTNYYYYFCPIFPQSAATARDHAWAEFSVGRRRPYAHYVQVSGGKANSYDNVEQGRHRATRSKPNGKCL